MSQMVEQVARLIANRLACGGDVFLPNVGSLFVVHHGAEQLSRRWIQPPYRRVDFTSQERGESLPDMIARAASCDADTARAAYDRWLEKTRKEEVLTIAGVGTLTYKNFALVSEFERRLNPQGRAPMRLRRSGCFDWVLVLGMMTILAAALVVGYYLMQERFFRLQQSTEPKMVAEPEVAEIPTIANPVVADSTETVQPLVPVQPTEYTRPAPGYYVVMGVFNTLENAENAKKYFAGKQPDWNYVIYRLGGRYMVTCFVSDVENTARDFVRNNRGLFPDIWVHTAR
ncbi:MAG: hypothetical protein K2G58_01005 [Alistipes sp.]|nr:hypothetical protein [Alistipes sp.]